MDSKATNQGMPLAALVCAFMAMAGEISAPNLDIQANSTDFGTLRRIQTRADTLLNAGQGYPLRREEVLEWLSNQHLSNYEQDYKKYRLPGDVNKAIAWSSNIQQNSFFLSPIAEVVFARARARDSLGTSTLTGVGATVYGRLSSRLTFFSRGMVYTEFTNRPQFSHQFSPEFGESYSVEKGAGDSLLKERTFNRFEHYLLLDLPHVTFKAGRDRLHLGPGYFSTLMASRETPPYYLLEARIDFSPWLRLDDYLLHMTDTQHGILKYANIHRFEFRPIPSLNLTFQDIVIYQDRGPDWRYLLPLSPLAFSEDNAGGGDNDAMSFNFLWNAPGPISTWGELFIDDLLGPSAFTDDFWENRWAALFGFQVVSPWRNFDGDLVVEWSQVEPWTYIGRSEQTSFKHFNVPSASKLGPDSRSLDIQLSWRPFRLLQWKEHWESNWKGVGRQATLGVVHDDTIDGLTKSLLGGEVDAQHLIHHGLDVHFKDHAQIWLLWDQVFHGNGADRVSFGLIVRW